MTQRNTQVNIQTKSKIQSITRIDSENKENKPKLSRTVISKIIPRSSSQEKNVKNSNDSKNIGISKSIKWSNKYQRP